MRQLRPREVKQFSRSHTANQQASQNQALISWLCVQGLSGLCLPSQEAALGTATLENFRPWGPALFQALPL